MQVPFPTQSLVGPADQDRPFRLGIITALKSRTTARCWPEVEERLRATVASLRHQSSAEWQGVIVGHDRPDFGQSLPPNLAYIAIDRPPPTPGPGGRYTRASQRQDKSAKRALGMRLMTNRHAITHWFWLDADDLLHRHFVATVARMMPFDLAVVRKGYAYYPSRRRSLRLDRLDRFCGSTVLTSDRWWIDPSEPEGRGYGGVNHRLVDAYAALRGVPVHDYPGRGVAYVLGHGDNLYRTIGRRVRVWCESRFLARPDDTEFLESCGTDAGG
jgi:hypothetical protein